MEAAHIVMNVKKYAEAITRALKNVQDACKEFKSTSIHSRKAVLKEIASEYAKNARAFYAKMKLEGEKANGSLCYENVCNIIESAKTSVGFAERIVASMA